MAQQLMVNSYKRTISVTLANGGQGTLVIDPEEAYFDTDDHLLMFTLRSSNYPDYADIGNGNFMLTFLGYTHDHQISESKTLQNIEKYLAPLGLQIAGGQLKSRTANRSNANTFAAVALLLGHSTSVVNWLINQGVAAYESTLPSQRVYGYCEMTTGELLFYGPIKA